MSSVTGKNVVPPRAEPLYFSFATALHIINVLRARNLLWAHLKIVMLSSYLQKFPG